VTSTRYATWDEVLDYCRRSANPVGRIVLRMSGYRSDALDQASDAVCTALQLTNFWQDLAVDWSRGRLYVPAEAWKAHGASAADLDRGAWSPAWRATLEDCGGRTRTLFDRGRAVCDGVGAGCDTNCAPRGWAGLGSSTGSSRRGTTCSARARRSAWVTGW
jgi:phytoene/squalene synthetase